MSENDNQESIDSLGDKIKRLKREVELIFFENSVYSWPDSETELLEWVAHQAGINKADQQELLLKIEEVRFLKERISHLLTE